MLAVDSTSQDFSSTVVLMDFGDLSSFVRVISFDDVYFLVIVNFLSHVDYSLVMTISINFVDR